MILRFVLTLLFVICYVSVLYLIKFINGKEETKNGIGELDLSINYTNITLYISFLVMFFKTYQLLNVRKSRKITFVLENEQRIVLNVVNTSNRFDLRGFDLGYIEIDGNISLFIILRRGLGHYYIKRVEHLNEITTAVVRIDRSN
ncbi:hypothetical protein BLOT_012426 [Blomia tropicalis]|nr:hypothetical protein BLOT_012426 [Blomia tropicalis]